MLMKPEMTPFVLRAPETEAEKAKQKSFVEMDKKESQAQYALHNQGFEAGYAAAANDYHNELVRFDIFATEKVKTDLMDSFAMGFEMGYFRKLAEILIF